MTFAAGQKHKSPNHLLPVKNKTDDEVRIKVRVSLSAGCIYIIVEWIRVVQQYVKKTREISYPEYHIMMACH